MSIACPHARLWLQRTFQGWISPSYRSVSTTSAIKRGLRATKGVEKVGHKNKVARKNATRDDQRATKRMEKVVRGTKPEFKEKAVQKAVARDAGNGVQPSKPSKPLKPTPRGTPHRSPKPEGAEQGSLDINKKAPEMRREGRDRSGKTTQERNSSVFRKHAVKVPWQISVQDRRGDDTLEDGQDFFRKHATRASLQRSVQDRTGHDILEVGQDLSVKTPTSVPAQSEKYQSESDVEIDKSPISIPYTTAASVFLYGSNAVLAALKGNRRKLYRFYWQSRSSSSFNEIRRLARKANVPSQPAASQLLDKMSEDRPHNGVVLEASSIPSPPVLSMGKPDKKTSTIPLSLQRQNAEDISINGAPGTISLLTNTWRHPLVVMLDGITDPGNVGSILRTCHFYGVEAVAIATNTCANINSATLAKASSGACEAVRILALPKPSDFVFESSKAGWRIFAAVTPEEPTDAAVERSVRSTLKHLTTSTLAASSTLAKHPCILMLGAEGEGLRQNLKRRADYFISIESGQRCADVPQVDVDSLNVSVATSVLLESFLRKPAGARSMVQEGDMGF